MVRQEICLLTGSGAVGSGIPIVAEPSNVNNNDDSGGGGWGKLH